MSDQERNTTTNPLEQLLSLLGTIDPIDLAGKAVDVTRRTSESLLTILENLASTVDNLNKTTTRINAAQLGDLSKRLGPLTTLAENAGGLFGLRPNKPSTTSTSSSQQTE